MNVPRLLGAPPTALVPGTVLLLAVLASDLWVYLDARRQREAAQPVVLVLGRLRIDTPEAWLVACLFLWVLAFPLYVVGRRRST